MIIKNIGLSIKTTALILVVLVLSFLTLDTKDLKIERENILQYLMSMDLGFSSRYNLVDDGRKEFHDSSDELEDVYHPKTSDNFLKFLI
jgi:hypothetical protein